MSYRLTFEQAVDQLRDDVETIKDELQTILDMDNIEDIKIALSDTINTVQNVLEDL